MVTVTTPAREAAVEHLANMLLDWLHERREPSSELTGRATSAAQALLAELNLYVVDPTAIRSLALARKDFKDPKTIEDAWLRCDAFQRLRTAEAAIAESVRRQADTVEEQRQEALRAAPATPDTSTYQLDKAAWCTR